MKLRYYFQKNFETRDHHELEQLRTRYYSCRKEEAMDAVQEVARDLKCKIQYVDNQRFEVGFENSSFYCTATISSTSFRETGVDFNILTYNILPTGKGIKVIVDVYKRLGKKIEEKR